VGTDWEVGWVWTTKESTALHTPEPAFLPTSAALEVLHASPDGLLLCDQHGKVVFANRPMIALSGYTRDEIVGANVDSLVPIATRSSHAAVRQDFHAAPVNRPMGAATDLRMRCRDGSELPVEISLSPVVLDDATYVVASVRDVSERRREELERRLLQRQVALLDDRERIARDLHDTVIQDLFAAGMRISAGLVRVTDPEVQARFSDVVDQIDATIRKVRGVVFDLPQHSLGHRSVTEMVQAAVDEIGRALEFRPQLTITGPVDDIDATVFEHALAVLREALSNVSRHAQASAALVRLSVVDGHVELRVEDNGRGIQTDVRHGSGTENIHYRAAELGGSATIAARDGGGTIVTWRVPDGRERQA
jgi:two-component system, NarL family, sensor histidine kinase DevS